MNLFYSTTQSSSLRYVCSTTFQLLGLLFCLCTKHGLAQTNGDYATPGLYTYTVPSGGPLQIRLTVRGRDGVGRGGCGASVGSTFTLQSGDLVTLIVGQSGVTLVVDAVGGGAPKVQLGTGR
ncbi:hypothetical protein [Spirosoma daeguense]